MSFLSTAVQQVLDDGPFCAVATATPRGPHCTPLVFAYFGRPDMAHHVAWLGEDPCVEGRPERVRARALRGPGRDLHRHRARPTTRWTAAPGARRWRAPRRSPGPPLRSARRTPGSSPGYAFDARQVPLAWTPPGRVFVGIDLDRTALLDEDGVQEGRGRWGGEAVVARDLPAREAGPRPARRAARRHGGLARAQRRGCARRSRALAGRWSLPVRWLAEPSALMYAALPAETLALAGAGPDAPVALTIDQASEWRARDMAGAMVQGEGRLPRARCAGLGCQDRQGDRRGTAPGRRTRSCASRRTRLVWWKGWYERAAQPVGMTHRRVLRGGRGARPRRCGRSRATPATSRSGTGTSCRWRCPRAACSAGPRYDVVMGFMGVQLHGARRGAGVGAAVALERAT